MTDDFPFSSDDFLSLSLNMQLRIALMTFDCARRMFSPHFNHVFHQDETTLIANRVLTGQPTEDFSSLIDELDMMTDTLVEERYSSSLLMASICILSAIQNIDQTDYLGSIDGSAIMFATGVGYGHGFNQISQELSEDWQTPIYRFAGQLVTHVMRTNELPADGVIVVDPPKVVNSQTKAQRLKALEKIPVHESRWQLSKQAL